MKVKGISWLGAKTVKFGEMAEFLENVLGLTAADTQPDFRVYRLPDGDTFELFGPAAKDPPHQFARNHLVAGFLVDDTGQARAALLRAGVELLGPTERGLGGYAWQHFRAPDGNVYELAFDPTHE